MQRQFQDLGQVEVTGQDVGFLAERAGLDATAAATRAGIFQRLALSDLLLDHRIGIEDRRESVAVANHAQGMFEQRIGSLAGQLQIAARLQQVHLVDDLQQQVRHFVGAVRSVRQQTAQVDVGKIGVRPALRRRHAHLGRSGMIVELDEERLQQLLGRFTSQRPVFQSLPIEAEPDAGPDARG